MAVLQHSSQIERIALTYGRDIPFPLRSVLTLQENRHFVPRIFSEPEHRGQYSNERSGASIETARKAGESR